MNKRILLVSPARNYPMGTGQYPSGALLLLGAILMREGNIVKVVHMAADRIAVTDFAALLTDFGPDIVGFTVSTYQTKHTRILSSIVKKFNDAVITVAGGLHPSALKSEFLKTFPDVDIVVYGEGEHAIVALSKGAPLSSIRGICYRDGDVVTNPPEPMLLPAELDTLPMPDKTLVNFKQYSGLFPVGRRPCMFIMSSRGCPYHCLPGSEQVRLASGGTKSISDIRLYDNVLSVDSSGHTVTSCVTATRRTPARGDIIKITSQDGGTLHCTSDHRVMTDHGWKEAGKLKVGDLVVRYRQVQNDEKRDDEIGASYTVVEDPQNATRTNDRVGKRSTQTKSKVQSNERRDSTSRIPTSTIIEADQTAGTIVREGKVRTQTTLFDKQPNEESNQFRKEQAIPVGQYRCSRESATTNAYKQPDEETGYSGQSQCKYASLQPRSKRKTVQFAQCGENTPLSNERCAETESQHPNEARQSYVEERHKRQSSEIPKTAFSVQPQKLSGEMVSKESGTEPSRISTGTIVGPLGIQVCRGWEVLDRPMSEREVPKPGFPLDNGEHQSGTTLQLGLLAQFAVCERCGDDEGLRDVRLESIYNHRRDAKVFTHDNQSSDPMVTTSAIISLSPCGPEEVFDIETTPHHNFIASDFVVHNCQFCSKSIYGNTLRLRSPDNVMEEIEVLHGHWGVREIHLSDDTFNANLDWAHGLLDKIINKGYNKKLIFRVALRVNEKILNTELLKHLKAAGVWFIYYGVENGNQGMLDRMGKGITVAEIKRAFKLTREVGINTEAFFIIGMPGETVETIKDSYNLYREIRPWWGGFSKAMPFPGTLFTQEVKAKGHLLCDNYDDFNPSDMMVRTDTMSADELNMWTNRLNQMTRKSKILKPKQMMYLAIDQARSVISEKMWTKPGGSI